ncbi:MAG: hypothetical protein MI921_10240 [Cytophagales bacterium]|nr:hypothetical protein [Cytophagales bacterium]
MDNENFIQLDFGFDTPKQEIKKEKASKPVKKDFVFEILDPISSPIIVYNSAWKDSLPKDLLSNIRMDRLMSSMKGEDLASFSEVVAYMMPRTFEHPMSHNWTNIYTWCGLQYAKTFKPNQVEYMSEIAPTNLDQYEQGLLNDLRRWIYRKRREALKVQFKAIKDIAPEEPGTAAQTDLFN